MPNLTRHDITAAREGRYRRRMNLRVIESVLGIAHHAANAKAQSGYWFQLDLC